MKKKNPSVRNSTRNSARNTTGDSPGKAVILKLITNPAVVSVGVVIILVGLGYYVFQVLSDAIHETPQAIFTQGFQNDLADISDLEGGGGWDMGYQYYLHFKGKRPIVLKHEKEFSEQYLETARRWFLAKYPTNPVLMDNQRSHLLVRRQANEISVMNQWVLYNSQTHDYFYRIWGFK